MNYFWFLWDAASMLTLIIMGVMVVLDVMHLVLSRFWNETSEQRNLRLYCEKRKKNS